MYICIYAYIYIMYITCYPDIVIPYLVAKDFTTFCKSVYGILNVSNLDCVVLNVTTFLFLRVLAYYYINQSTGLFLHKTSISGSTCLLLHR